MCLSSEYLGNHKSTETERDAEKQKEHQNMLGKLLKKSLNIRAVYWQSRCRVMILRYIAISNNTK